MAETSPDLRDEGTDTSRTTSTLDDRRADRFDTHTHKTQMEFSYCKEALAGAGNCHTNSRLVFADECQADVGCTCDNGLHILWVFYH